jgi:phage tail-like protein
MPGPDAYPLPAFHFVVRFDGGTAGGDASFQEVGGFGPELETESFHEGGENRFLHQLPTGVKQPRLVLRRGVAAADSGLVKWCKDVLEGGLAQRIVPRHLQVALLDAAGDPLRSWSFDNAWPVQWTMDAFRADKNEVALEKIELHYASSRREL